MINLKNKRLTATFLLTGIICISLLTACSSDQAAKESKVYIGIKDKYGETNLFRTPFKYENGKWFAMPHSPANPEELANIINLYPKTIDFPHNITATRPDKWGYYNEIGSFKVSSEPATSVISSKSAVQPIPVKDVIPTDSDKKEAAATLKQMFPTYTRYDYNEETETATVLGKVQWTTADLHFKGIEVDGYTFITANAKPELQTDPTAEIFDRIEDKGSEASGIFLKHWFVMINDNPIYLGKQMELIGHADYADTKGLQFIFRVWGYNDYGYVLFSNNFRNKIEFTWHDQ